MTYTTVNKVKRELNNAVDFTTLTRPSINEVEEMINEESSWVDRITANRWGNNEVVAIYSSDKLLKDEPVLNLKEGDIANLVVEINTASKYLAPNWSTLTEYEEYNYVERKAQIKLYKEKLSYTGISYNREDAFKVTYERQATPPAWVSGAVARRVALKIAEQVLFESLHEGTSSIKVGDMDMVKPSDLGASLYDRLEASVKQDEKRLNQVGGVVLYND